ncbi:MAG: hypothetical protein HOW73_07440 [Polyangiaceae bacterium]|nr:hypothetical protein [Polyangiaceae bacterium]
MADNPEMVKRASKLIRAGEISDMDQSDEGLRAGFKNNKAYKPHIPSDSGLTVGHGHDLGQSTPEEIDAFYGPSGVGSGAGSDYGPQGEIFTKDERDILKKFAGKRVIAKKKDIKAALKVTKTITLTYEEAVEVFERKLLPRKGIEPAREAFPGFDDLPPLQQAAIVDRVYMRGTGVSELEKSRGGEQMLVDLKAAVFERNTQKVYAAIQQMEQLHTKRATIKRARVRSEMALEGYLQTTRITHH